MRADARFGLRDLVRMMDGDVILPTAMDVEEIAEVALRHCRAFDVPTGKAATPRTVPFHLPLFGKRRKFPEREVGRVSLLPLIHAFAGFEPFDVEAREMTVIRLLARVEIDSVGRPIRVAVLL